MMSHYLIILLLLVFASQSQQSYVADIDLLRIRQAIVKKYPDKFNHMYTVFFHLEAVKHFVGHTFKDAIGDLPILVSEIDLKVSMLGNRLGHYFEVNFL